jgi:hypothetical protein
MTSIWVSARSSAFNWSAPELPGPQIEQNDFERERDKTERIRGEKAARLANPANQIDEKENCRAGLIQTGRLNQAARS